MVVPCALAKHSRCQTEQNEARMINAAILFSRERQPAITSKLHKRRGAPYRPRCESDVNLLLNNNNILQNDMDLLPNDVNLLPKKTL